MNTKNVSRSLLNSNITINESVSNDSLLLSKAKSFFNKIIFKIKKDINSVTIKDVYFFNNDCDIEICKNIIIRQKSVF